MLENYGTHDTNILLPRTTGRVAVMYFFSSGWQVTHVAEVEVDKRQCQNAFTVGAQRLNLEFTDSRSRRSRSITAWQLLLRFVSVTINFPNLTANRSTSMLAIPYRLSQ